MHETGGWLERVDQFDTIIAFILTPPVKAGQLLLARWLVYIDPELRSVKIPEGPKPALALHPRTETGANQTDLRILGNTI